jgi:hypothetical protein
MHQAHLQALVVRVACESTLSTHNALEALTEQHINVHVILVQCICANHTATDTGHELQHVAAALLALTQ